MLERLLKRRPAAFVGGTVQAVDAATRRAQVRLQSGLTTWVPYGQDMDLTAGQPVIVARDGQRFVVQKSEGGLPSTGSLLEL